MVLASPSLLNHARLIDVVGKPRTSGDVLFVPALLEVEDLTENPEFRLEDHPGARGIGAGGVPLAYGWHGLWVRARIPRLFHFTPLLCVNNWQPLVNLAFVAAGRFEPTGELTAYPFVCMEGFDPQDTLREEPLVGLSFSRHGPNEERRALIARCFWSLLLEDPHDLEPFVDFYHQEYEGYYIVGFQRGSFFFEQTVEEDREEEIGSQAPMLLHETSRCPDCGGAGVEETFVLTEDCATCGGTGTITW